MSTKIVLVKKKVLELDPKNIKIIENINIYDTYKDFYLCNDGWETKFLKDNQSENGLKVWLGAAKGDGTSLTFKAEKNTIKRTLRNRISIRFYFGHFFFELLTLPLLTPWKYFCTTGVNVLEKVLLCTGETLAAYTLQKLSINVKLYVHSRRDTLYHSHFNSISDTLQKEYQLDDWHHQLVSLKLESLLKQTFFGN